MRIKAKAVKKTMNKLLMAPGVNKVFARKAQAVLDDLKGHGYDVRPTQVLRSASLQRLYYAHGRSDAALKEAGFTALEIAKYRRQGALATSKRITGTLKSKHIDGVAMDVAFYVDGKITWDDSYSGWAVYGKACKAHELTWGGSWKTFKDLPHCELP